MKEYRHLRIVLPIVHVILLCLLMRCSADSGHRCAPSIEDYATIEAYVGEDEIPVYAFGYTYVWGQSPDLQPGAMAQQGNLNPITKIQLKKSWEIESNLCGSTPAREPKTMWNDDQPLLPIHLIDGDTETAWSSRGMIAAADRPEWIRIDLPAESTIAAVNLVCSNVGPSTVAKYRFGKSLPKDLTIKVSRDGKDWQTVYENSEFTGSDAGANLITIQPQPAKMVWVIGKTFANVGEWGPSFSLGQLEVLNPTGENLALVSRGSGVQVSTTHYGYGMDRFTQEMLWPIQYDLGFKWTRVGYDMGTFLWSYVEREKGVLRVDPRSDEVITEAHNNGMNVILCLDKGNWLYHDPPRKTDWKKSRVREIMETYYDYPDWPSQSEELMQGYLRYVDYMVRHFKGRVAYYEICNEWYKIGVENYCRIVNATLKTIKNADPDARIMLGSTGGFNTDAILRALGTAMPPRIKNRKLELTGRMICVPKGLKQKDVTVRVDAQSIAEAGIVLRFQDDKNYILANYYPAVDSIYFHEVVDGQWGPAFGQIETKDLGPNIHIEARIEGASLTLTLSDGTKSFTTSHAIQKYHDAGAIGLSHGDTSKQCFDNFLILDASGKKLFDDNFDQPDGPLGLWDTSGNLDANPEKIADQIDAIGWHPFYQVDPDNTSYRNYEHDVNEFKTECQALGFKGIYVASEWTWAAPYPGHPDWCTEMTKAKYASRLMTIHCGLNVVSLFNETFQTGKINWDCNLLRNSSFQVDPITPSQPQPVYYALRNISTILDGFKADEFDVKFSGDRVFDCYTFSKGDQRMFSAWIKGKTKDGIVEAETDITIPDIHAKTAWVFDSLNGTKQNLNLTHQDNDTILEGILIKDYPVFIRLTK